jgi:hypothetical protein
MNSVVSLKRYQPQADTSWLFPDALLYGSLPNTGWTRTYELNAMNHRPQPIKLFRSCHLFPPMPDVPVERGFANPA